MLHIWYSFSASKDLVFVNQHLRQYLPVYMCLLGKYFSLNLPLNLNTKNLVFKLEFLVQFVPKKFI